MPDVLEMSALITNHTHNIYNKGRNALVIFLIIESQVTTLSLQQLIKALRKNRGRFEACVYICMQGFYTLKYKSESPSVCFMKLKCKRVFFFKKKKKKT